MSSPIAAVIFDWAGTVIDYGSCAPAEVFQTTFARRGITITAAQAREPMGKAKRDHIQSICGMPGVSQAWLEKFGHVPREADIDALYADFLPLQKSVLLQFSQLIPGARETYEFLTERGIAVGSSTGYTRELMDILLPAAAQQGFRPQAVLCADDVPEGGRPKPYLIWENLKRLDRFPTSHTVKVDDTPVGIQAGKNAGCITVAICKSGNEMGLKQAEVERMPPDELQSRLAQIRKMFSDLGADYTLDTVADLPSVIAQIEQTLGT